MNLLIADAHPVSREGIEVLIERYFPESHIETVDSLDNLTVTLQKGAPDVLVFDPESLELTKPAQYRKIRNLAPEAHLLAISDRPKKEYILSVIENGVQSFLTKGCSADEIEQAILSTLDGEKFFCNKVLNEIVDRSPASESCDPTSLTKRELEIIQLICDGLKTVQIAEQLNLSVHTVNTHRKNIMNKLQFKTPAELIRYAYTASIIKVES
ncbi:response regulator transcription factor [bacterium SCSIO 12741]|nr:response regulator transcription factor [bacterium SCSIO 12741]